MQKHKLPKIGARNFKTALAIFFCILICEFLSFDTAFYAAITAAICMQDSFENSIAMGKNRFIGTIIGAIAGSLGTIILRNHNTFMFRTCLVFLLSIAVIYACTCINKPGSVTIACIVLLGTLLLNRDFSNHLYTITRSIQTLIGIFIALLVNLYVLPRKQKKEEIV